MLSKMKSQVLAVLSALVGWIGLGTVVYHLVEGWSWITAFYFSVTTLSTVGYGDLYPTTEFSRLFTALYILVGVGVMIVALGIIGSNLLERREQRIIRIREKRRNK